MKKTKIFLAIILCLSMICGVLASCSGGDNTPDETNPATSEEKTTEKTESPTEKESESSEEESESGSIVGPVIPPDTDQIDGIYSEAIEYANLLKNGVQSYYPNGISRDRYYVENLDMSAEFALVSGTNQNLTYLKNKSGATYIADTMDVFIRMKDNKTYYASDSGNNARANVYRIGYYYYDVRILDQSFYDTKDTVSDEIVFNLRDFKYYNANSIGLFQNNGRSIRYMVSGNDPYFSCSSGSINFSVDDYTAIQLTIKSSNANQAQLFISTSNNRNFTNDQSVSFAVQNDGEFHTYNVMLPFLKDCSGDVLAMRLDLGQKNGETIEIKDIKAVKFDTGSPLVLLDRTWHTYSDKLHQELHFIAPVGQDNIDALGMITEIAADRVSKLIVKDKNGTHTSLGSVDWASAEYIGFDIKDAGIFGYIMPADGSSGTMTVTLDGENYVIIQEAAPENGEILSPKEVGSTENDFFMGQRIYTDESHDFTEFLNEAELERHPLNAIQSDGYVKYDALRGAYLFNIGGTSFNPPFFSSWNQHFSTEIKLRSMDSNRNIYIRTSTSSGCLENAVILDKDGMLIPIPLEVSKNFGEGEEPIMNYGDETYGETVFPFVAEKGERYEFSILNLYQNWGKFPIKQLSSIAYYAPYYHLSCGVTETTCISPWYVRGRTLWTLPDFRAQSAPYWFELEGDAFQNQPQHTNAGLFEILHYNDKEGNFIASENYLNVIDSSGPIYAEVRMDYVSDDGKMKISYNHLELPQTDELRPYYEVNIEILEDISFDNFKNDFTFYAWNTVRTHVGYLNADGERTEAPYSSSDDVTEYVLGKVGGYFGNFGTSSSDATNLGFVIHSSDINIGGQKFDGSFVVVEDGENRFRLTLDLAEASFKKGDVITLNILMVPWGSHLSTDASNLEYIRQTSVIDPYKVTAQVGEVIESTYLPRVRATNGESVEFTVSGGINNAAVRVYGFNKLTSPKIYEKIGNEWVEYNVSSSESPDAVGLRHYYDGYMTYYDGDGTYSYAFAFSMDDVESRTFKVEAKEDFVPWPKEIFENNDPINVYLDANEIAIKFTETIPGVGSATISDDASYVRLTGDGKNAAEVRIDIFSAISKDPTGKYLVVKYRIPESNPNDRFEFFTSTINSSPKREDSIWLNSALSVKDGEWHILVVDASSYIPSTFVADSDGNYYANYISFDVFNAPMGEDDYVDLAYVGICEDLSEFRQLPANEGIESYTLSSKSKTEIYSISTGELLSTTDVGGGTVVTPTDDGVTISNNAAELISGKSNYSLSSVLYYGKIDALNGYGPSFITGTSYNNRGSSSNGGIATFKYNGRTTDDLHMVFSGWSLVYGGIEKYVWSVDGITWYDAELYNKAALGKAGTGMINYANDGCGVTDFELYADNASYQGNLNGPDTASGLAADLSAYEGQTVSVTFAVVPKTDTDSLCILARVTGIEVSKAPVSEDNNGAPDEVENPYNDPINYFLDASEINAMLKDALPKGTGSITYAEDGSYIRFYGDGNVQGESFFNAYLSAEKVATGRYIVIKYRMPSTNSERNYLQLFASTVNSSATGSDSISFDAASNLKDDAWHVVIVDAASFLPSSYVPEGGRYYAKYVRLDVINTKMSATSYIDIAYFGITDDLDVLRQLSVNADMDTMTLVLKDKTQFVNVKTGAITDNENGTNKPTISYVSDPNSFIDANNAQGYVASDTNYFSRVDAINGLGAAGSTTTAYDMGSNDKNGIAVINYKGTSTADKKLVLAGWSLVLGGIEKYVWSADGGKTWNDVTFVGISKPTNAYAGLFTFTQGKYGSEVDFSPYGANSCYQTSLGTAMGLGADLSSFAGQTVNVTFAAVSAENTNELCILLHVIDVSVAE